MYIMSNASTVRGANNTTNFVNVTLPDIPVSTYPKLWTWFGFDVFTSVTGCILSYALLTIIRRRSFEKSRCNLLICHLLILDIFNVGIFSPIDYTMIMRTQLSHSVLINCDIFTFFRSGFYSMTYWTAAALAVNRFVATFMAHHYKLIFTRTTMIFYILTMWILVLGSQAGTLFQAGGKAFWWFPVGMCMAIQKQVANTVATHIGLTIPLLTEGVAFILLIGKLCWQQCRRRSHPNGSPRSRRNVILIRLLALTYLWNIGCFLPLPLITFFTRYKLDYYTFLWLRAVEQWGSAGTPIIFICMNTEYQRQLKNLWKPLRKISPGNSNSVQMRGLTSNTMKRSHGSSNATAR